MKKNSEVRNEAMFAALLIISVISCIACVIPIIVPAIFGYVVAMAKNYMKLFSTVVVLGAVFFGQILFAILFSFFVWLCFMEAITFVMLKVAAANMIASSVVYFWTLYVEKLKEQKIKKAELNK